MSEVDFKIENDRSSDYEVFLYDIENHCVIGPEPVLPHEMTEERGTLSLNLHSVPGYLTNKDQTSESDVFFMARLHMLIHSNLNVQAFHDGELIAGQPLLNRLSKDFTPSHRLRLDVLLGKHDTQGKFIPMRKEFRVSDCDY